MTVLHRHKYKQEVVIILLYELIEELSGLLNIGGEFKTAHVSFPLSELVLDGFYFLEKLDFGTFFLSDSKDYFLCENVSMLALDCIRLVSIHWVVHLRVI